jgi:hypothetical protein
VFNSTNSEISFNATGPIGSTGYAKVTIAKTLMQNITGCKVYLDGKTLNFSAVDVGNSWLVTLDYHHSTHRVSIYLNREAPPSPTLTDNLLLLVILAFIAAFAAAIVVALRKSKRESINADNFLA